MGKVWQIDSFRAFGKRKFGKINRSALIVSTNLDGFSLANHGQFAKLSCYTVVVYICICELTTGSLQLQAITEPLAGKC